MADWEALAEGLWEALAEFDVDAIQAEAEKDSRLALIGASGSGKTSLACTLAEEPAGECMPVELKRHLAEYRLPLSVEDIGDLESAALLILLLDATKGNYVQEVAAADYLSYLGRPMLVCYNKMDMVPVETRLIHGQARWRGAEIMPLTAIQTDTVRELLVPAVLEVLPEHALSLARHLPLFRDTLADRLIERTARVDATYASASGLAETVPLLRVSLSAEDIRMLSANQATMAYRLGLAYGLPLDWHRDLTALRSAVEADRVWQQLARRVVGVIPLWRLNSKVALAYSGTVVMGRAIQKWCDTGQTLSDAALRKLCREIAAQSQATSRDLVAKARDALPAPRVKPARPRRLKARLPRPRLPRRRPRPDCPACGRKNPPGAAFCAFCGVALGKGDGRSEEQAAGD